MYKVPCGQNMGHGSSCTDGYLCDSCERITELEAKLAEIGKLIAFEVPHAPVGAQAVWLSDLQAIVEGE